jgi:DNA-binding NarL/FixJ family response regulator
MPHRPYAGAALSDRERQVLQLVAEGQSNKQIGAALGIESNTVKTHLSRIGLKLQVGDRAGMVATGFRKGILQ